MRIGRICLLLPPLFWSSWFALTPQRFSTVVFTLNAHGQVSYKFPLANIGCSAYVKRNVGTGYVSFTCMHWLCLWLACLGQPAFYPTAPFAQSRALLPLSPALKSFDALYTNHSKPRKAHLTKGNDLKFIQLFASYSNVKINRKTKNPMHEMSCGSRYIYFVRN